MFYLTLSLDKSGVHKHEEVSNLIICTKMIYHE